MKFRQKYLEMKYAKETNDLDKNEFRLIKTLINADLGDFEKNIIEKLDDYIEKLKVIYLMGMLFLFIMGILLGALLVMPVN